MSNVMTRKSVRDKIDPYLLSLEKTAAFEAVRLNSIQQSKPFRIRLQQKTLELSGSGADPSQAADIVTEAFERELDRSGKLFEIGKLPLEAFVAGYRENTDSGAWPSVILEVKGSCEMDRAAAVLEAQGFPMAENPFPGDGGAADKFRIFRYLHVHIPPDQAFLIHIAGLDFADYLFDAERVISLPDPIRSPARGDVAPELSDGRNLIFPGGMWSADWPENLGADVKIAIIDSGIDTAHPDFEGRIAAARDFTDEGDGLDHCGHGTHVAGIAAGSGAASEGRFMGISRNSKLIDAKIFGKDGAGSNQLILAGMRWAYDQGARVMNMSLGSNGTRTDGKSLLSRACDVLAGRVVVCVSAGNSGPSPGTVSSPGDARDAVTIGAVDRFKKMAAFSSRGPTDEPHVTGDKPDWWAIPLRVAVAILLWPLVVQGLFHLTDTAYKNRKYLIGLWGILVLLLAMTYFWPSLSSGNGTSRPESAKSKNTPLTSTGRVLDRETWVTTSAERLLASLRQHTPDSPKGRRIAAVFCLKDGLHTCELPNLTLLFSNALNGMIGKGESIHIVVRDPRQASLINEELVVQLKNVERFDENTLVTLGENLGADIVVSGILLEERAHIACMVNALSVARKAYIQGVSVRNRMQKGEVGCP